MTDEQRAYDLAELIVQILGEGVYADSEKTVKKSTIILTSSFIQRDIECGLLKKREDGLYWTSDFIERYGGFIDEELDPSVLSPTSYEVKPFYD